MPHDGFDARRVFPGLGADDIGVPHRLLGLAAGESDPLAIVRAADQRLASVRGNVPPELAAERDALMAQVEAARDAMLAAAVAARAATASAPPVVPAPVHPPVPTVPPPSAPAALIPPPVPPPVPPAVAAGNGDPFEGALVRVSRRRVRAAGRSDGTGLALVISALAVAAAALAIYVAWPQLQRPSKVARRQDPVLKPEAPKPPKPRPKPEPEPLPPRRREREPNPYPKPEPTPEPSLPPEPAPRPKPEPSPSPPSDPEPAPSETPSSPPVDAEAVRARVGEAIAKAYAAIRSRDFAAAKRELGSVAEAALEDQQATDRLQRWQQFVVYAEAYPEYRVKALASAAASSATYDLGKRQIGVVEFNEREFVYRDSRQPGRNQRSPRDAIPPDIERLLVEQWFAKDGRAANHLFLGAAALSGREPDLVRARREWEAAAAGGESDGRLLLGILDDAVVRGR